MKKPKITVKSTAIFSRVVILLFLIMLMLFVNINSVTYLLNAGNYESVFAKIDKPTTDKFLLLIPEVELTYHYQGKSYTDTKLFVLEPFFGLDSGAGTELLIHVNTSAPNHFLIDVHFYRNIINWILLLLEIVCVYNIIYKVRKKKKKKEEQNYGRSMA